MAFLDRFSTKDKTNAILSVALIGAVLLWSSSMYSTTPSLPKMKDAVPRTEAQKTGFPSQENLPTYQTAEQSNEGQTPSYSTNSAFGK